MFDNTPADDKVSCGCVSSLRVLWSQISGYCGADSLNDLADITETMQVKTRVTAATQGTIVIPMFSNLQKLTIYRLSVDTSWSDRVQWDGSIEVCFTFIVAELFNLITGLVYSSNEHTLTARCVGGRCMRDVLATLTLSRRVTHYGMFEDLNR